jgi:uncharacterized damage-inducible protein DinB
MINAEALRTELEIEAAVTRKVLARVPDDQLSWRPHERSMSLGQLALHVAQLPRAFAEMMQEDEMQAPTVPLPEPRSTGEVLTTLDDGVALATRRITEWGDDGLAREWHLLAGDATLLRMPRGQVVRTLMLNHSYHHRGQITVYLRLLGVPVPSVYGPTADER